MADRSIAMALACGSALALAACQEREVTDVPIAQEKVQVMRRPVVPTRDIDILWVIDNSASMEGEQANLIANFPAFMEVLAAQANGLPNVHMGVVSTAGRALGVGGCAGGGGALLAPPGKSPYISDVLPVGATTRTTSWSGDGYASLAEAFSAYAAIGTGGCGFEQHFQSVIDAVSPTANPGFLRHDAYLAVIFVTDEDDCSGALGSNAMFENSANAVNVLGPLSSFRCWEFGVTCDGDAPGNERTAGIRNGCDVAEANAYAMPLAAITTALAAVKPKRKTFVASIAGDTDAAHVRVINKPSAWTAEPSAVTLAPSCVQPGAGDVYADAQGEQYIARPAVRLAALLRYFGLFSSAQSICASDLTPALTQIASSLSEPLSPPCFASALLDTDPSAPGLQPDCKVSLVTNLGEPNQTEVQLPPCASGLTLDCWRIAADPAHCSEADHLLLETPLTPSTDDQSNSIVANCTLL